MPLLTGVNFNSVFGGIGNALKDLCQSVYTNWKVWLIGLLVSTQVGTAYGCYHEHSLYVREVTAHKADNDKFIAAQRAANIEEQNVRKQLQIESKAASHEADTNYSALLTKYNASLMRYASTNKSGSGSTNNYQLSAAKSSDGPGTDPNIPDQINITRSDAEICAVNTARLQSAHDWAVQQLSTEKTNDTKAIESPGS